MIQILHVDTIIDDGVPPLDLYPSPPGNAAWNDVFGGPLEEYCASFDLCLNGIDITNGTLAPRRGLDICVICNDWSVFEKLATVDFNLTAVFSPSPAALLDAVRMSRRTLIAARILGRDHQLTEKDIESVDGGSGAGTTCRAAFIGRRTAYDIAFGEALDFGKLK